MNTVLTISGLSNTTSRAIPHRNTIESVPVDVAPVRFKTLYALRLEAMSPNHSTPSSSASDSLKSVGQTSTPVFNGEGPT